MTRAQAQLVQIIFLDHYGFVNVPKTVVASQGNTQVAVTFTINIEQVINDACNDNENIIE